MKGSHTSQPLDVRVIHTSGCPKTPPTIDLIKTVATEMRVNISLQEIEITDETPEQARKFKMLGSPTVRINGLDIDPAVRGNKHYGFT